MKRVWLLNHYAKSPRGVGGTRHYHLARYLRERGWEMTIIAASVDHVTGEQRLQKNERTRLECIDGVSFLWVKAPRYKGNGGGRIRNMLAYTSRVVRRSTTAQLARPHVVIGSSVHPFAAVAAAFIARRFRVPFIFEVRDLWPQTLIDMGRLKERSVMTWSLRMLELWLYRRACRILVLLPLASRYIVPLGISRERIHWLPNGVDLSQYRATDTPNRSRDDCFTLMYFGGHGQANALDNLLQAMFAIQQNSSNPRIILRLIGDGPLKPALMSHARSIGLANVCFEPSVGKSEIPKLATQADAFVISIPNLPNLYRFGVSPNKLFDYFAAGRPIIIAGEVGNNPVTESNAGFCVPPEKPNELAKAVMQMARTPALERHRMGRNAREYVERNHEFSVLAKRMAEMLDSVVVVPGSGERAC